MGRPRSTASAAAYTYVYDELKASNPVRVADVAAAFGLTIANADAITNPLRRLVMEEDGVYINHPSPVTDWFMMKTTDPAFILPGVAQIARSELTTFTREHEQAQLWTPSVTGRATLRAAANADIITAADVAKGAAAMFLSQIESWIAGL